MAVLKIGDFIKIKRATERFWVEVIKIEKDGISGRIDNDLICTDEHGLKYNGTIKFPVRDIVDIHPQQEES